MLSLTKAFSDKHPIMLGMLSVFDLSGIDAGSMRAQKKILSKSDIEAIGEDFKAVGDDLRNAMNQYEKEQLSSKNVK